MSPSNATLLILLMCLCIIHRSDRCTWFDAVNQFELNELNLHEQLDDDLSINHSIACDMIRKS